MRAQIAVEFSFMIMLAIIFFGVVLIIVVFHSERARAASADLEIEDLVERVSAELLLAASVEDGYQRSFFIPSIVAGRGFTIDQGETSLTMQLSDGAAAMRTIPALQGSLVHGNNTVRTANGIIWVNS